MTALRATLARGARSLTLGAIATALFLFSRGARANEPSSASLELSHPRTESGLAALDQPTGIAEFGFGWLTLPGAAICVAPLTRCSEGDSSFELDAWQLYRGSKRFAFGAGVLLGLIPTNNPDLPKELERKHSRQYLTIEGTIRYYPYVGQRVEWWVGLIGGLVVVSDRFEAESEAPDRALLGPRGVTIRTEGGSLGLAGGPVVALTENWALGATARWGQWFLPENAAFDPLGSSASLTGRVTFVSVGLSVALRMPL